jgi:uncharacterized protein (TIGR02145 family)
MQLVNIDNCPTTQTMVVDARDNHTYWIRKIPGTGAGGSSDLCWMETNLAYAGGGTNTYGDVKTLTTVNSGAMGNTAANVRTNVTTPTGAPQFTTSPTLPTTGNGADTGANGAQYGYHYNWCAAMGGPTVNPNACDLTSTSGTDPTASICPAGWRLPTAGANGTTAQNNNTNEFWNLNSVVNSGSTASDAGLRTNWLGVYAGGVNTTGNFSNVGTYGYYWSSSIYNASASYNLNYNSTGVTPAVNLNKATGFSVRCVL